MTPAEKMANIPADYLLWLYNEGKCFGEQENLSVLKEELAKKQSNDRPRL